MKPRTLILLTVAVGCGLIAAFLVSQGKSQEQTLKVPVAKNDIRSGTYIDSPEKFFDVQERPVSQIGAKAIKAPDQLKGKVVQKTINQNDMVSTDQIVDSGGLTDKLPDGLRAMTLRVTVDSAVAGFIIPTSHVDLVCMVPDQKNPRDLVAKVFMQNKEVLAVNTDDVKPENTKTIQPAMVTLALTPEEVERMTRALRDGIPTLVLRNPKDKEIVRTPGAINPFGRSGTDDIAPDSKKVLRAKQAIPAGTVLSADLFEAKSMPTEHAPSDAVPEGGVNGKKLDKPLAANAVLTVAYLASDNGSGETIVEVRPNLPKRVTMKIYDGANPRTVIFDGGETLPPGTTTTPTKEGGSEGK